MESCTVRAVELVLLFSFLVIKKQNNNNIIIILKILHIYAFTFSFYEYRLVFWLGLKEALYALLDKQASVSDAVGFKSISQIMYLLQNGHSIAISIPVTVSQPYHGLMNLWTDISFHSNFAEIWYGPFGSRHTHYRQQVSFGFFFLSFFLFFHMAPKQLCLSFFFYLLYLVLPIKAPGSSHVFPPVHYRSVCGLGKQWWL